MSGQMFYRVEGLLKAVNNLKRLHIRLHTLALGSMSKLDHFNNKLFNRVLTKLVKLYCFLISWCVFALVLCGKILLRGSGTHIFFPNWSKLQETFDGFHQYLWDKWQDQFTTGFGTGQGRIKMVYLDSSHSWLTGMWCHFVCSKNLKGRV